MYKDNIISEVWKNKALYAEKFHHNLEEMIKDLSLRQKKSNRYVIDRRISSIKKINKKC